ncbi:chaperone NapD [Paracandidimonas soli]|uniref:Chaperone NapD n=1 Tax=Paracandidimonas soli TaxID=1917182 RepID=A0A4R3UMY5_9BURK|nr:chaperone NapD [Paracandidimonas soli]TCU91920.1 periplasmic nitrate reductase chaperone NapD [Paracandidimonas soli]
MRIASLLVRAQPEHVPALELSLPAIPGVEVHRTDIASGTLILTVEDGEGYAVSDSIVAVNLAQHVMAATLVYEHNDETLEPETVNSNEVA